MNPSVMLFGDVRRWISHFLSREQVMLTAFPVVMQGTKIEEMYAGMLPEIQLGSEISKASPVEFRGIWKLIFFFIRDRRFRSESRVHSDQKIEILYKSVIWGAVIVIVLYGLLGGIQIRKCALLSLLLSKPCT